MTTACAATAFRQAKKL